MQGTALTFLDEPFRLEEEATVLAVTPEDGRWAVVLDRTVFYPQGGGQAFDTGTLVAGGTTFTVAEVRHREDQVCHLGTFAGAPFAVGQTVRCAVDGDRRRLNSRAHTAGHVLDEAVKDLGYSWKTTKGTHYPGQMAVEFAGDPDAAGADQARDRIQAEIDRLLAADTPVSITRVPVADLAKAGEDPEALAAHAVDGRIRVVNIGGRLNTFCGGTHVRRLSDIGRIHVRYVKAKKGTVKVGYELG